MSVEIVRGTSNKPAASRALATALAGSHELTGQLFIGHPIVPTAGGIHAFDALLMLPDRGIVVFDLVEGDQVEGHRERQDLAANLLDAQLRTHRELVQRRALRIEIHTLSFAPAASIDEVPEDDYWVATESTLVDILAGLRWDTADSQVFHSAVSAIENITAIRRGRAKRVIEKADSRGAKLEKLEASIATLDPRQHRAVIETADGVQRIRGLAGSGKTIVLALKAARLHVGHPEWRIAVSFHTRSLKEQFRRLINGFCIEMTRGEPDWTRIRVVNAWGSPRGGDSDGIYLEFCRTHGIDYFDFGTAKRRFGGAQKAFKGACQQSLDQFRQGSERPPVYDAILIDEAQDLPGAFLQICYELLREPRRLVYAYDELQNLSGGSVPPPEVLFGAVSDGTPRVRLGAGTEDADQYDIILETCYRNSRPVLLTAHALGFGVFRDASEPSDTNLIQMFDDSSLWREIGYRAGPGTTLQEGSDATLFRPEDTSPRFLEEHSAVDDLIQFVRFDSKKEQCAWVVGEIQKNLQHEELRHDDIVVINPDPFTTRDEVGPIRARLLDMGVDSHLAGVDTSADEFFQEHSDSVTFTGIHRAKGNEAGMVYVINAQDCHGTGRNLASIRNRLFTAITRSKAWVRVLGIGAGMDALSAEYERLKAADFELRFTYPTAAQRKQLRVVHRDMTAKTRQKIQKHSEGLSNLIEDIESGRVDKTDLDAQQLAALKKLLDE